jgi:hypothetical protein
MRFFSFIRELRDKHLLHLRARPGSFPEKREAGFYARIVKETTDRESTPQLNPPVSFDQLRDDRFQRDAVQGIAGMGNGRWVVHVSGKVI